ELDQVLEVYDDVRIDGPDGGLTLDAGGNSRVIDSLVSGTVLQLENISLINGHSGSDGGGMRVFHNTLMMSGCTATNHFSDEDGGAIYAYEATLEVNDSVFMHNRSHYSGGTVYLNRSVLNTRDSQVNENSAQNSGGAVYGYDNSTANLTNTIFEANGARYSGGAVYFSGGLLTVTDSTFVENTATNDSGGAVYASNLIMNRSRVESNRANDDGGGIYNYYDGSYTNCLFAGNIAGRHGGGLYLNRYNERWMVNCTVAGNLAGEGYEGGGIYSYYSSYLNLINSVVAENRKLPTDPDDNYNTLRSSVSNWIGTIDGDPLFVQNPTAGADGIWNTEDDQPGDYHFVSTSPLHDGGDTNHVAEGALDLDGFERIRGASVDIGAFEWTHLTVAELAEQYTEAGVQVEVQCRAEDIDITSNSNITVSWSLGADAPAGAEIGEE
ncbi:MAG TPA: choice-of-anchor Q domain-containing protein, partial [Tichowtungia sp.]|nr:choice-of-anchor Q domain-containing protein [Tichowtungia sp.]